MYGAVRGAMVGWIHRVYKKLSAVCCRGTYSYAKSICLTICIRFLHRCLWRRQSMVDCMEIACRLGRQYADRVNERIGW